VVSVVSCGCVSLYGCPTRLLDFTYSFYIAAYFAVYQSGEDSKPCIWVFNRIQLGEVYRSEAPEMVTSLLREDVNIKKTDTIRAILNDGRKGFIDVNPFALNERLVLQQGLFLMPVDVSSTLEENVVAALSAAKSEEVVHVIHLDFGIKEIVKSIDQLHLMNVRYTTLFPGLDGFGKYLASLVPLDELYMACGDLDLRY